MSKAARLVLASGSPRRKELLGHLHVEFSVHPADLDESQKVGESPHDYVARLSREKAAAVHARFPGSWVLAADTSVVIDEDVLGKPASDTENIAMLSRLSGRTHRVLTGLTLRGDEAWTQVVETIVHFRALTSWEMATYAATGEGHDKAGGYASQAGGAAFITHISGSPSNVIGLPLAETALLLTRAGLRGA